MRDAPSATLAAPSASRTKPNAFTRGLRRHSVGFLLALPFFALFAIFTIAPVIVAAYLSLTDFNMIEPPRFVGAANYRLLFIDDDVFILAIRNTLVFAVITGPLSFVLSFLMAWLINPIRRRTMFALAFYTPSITSGIAMAVVWLYFFSADRYGLANSVLLQAGILREPQPWLQDVNTIMPAVMLVSLWMSMGTQFLVFIAGLQGVPAELYEAGAIDGVSGGTGEVWHIALPMIRPQLLFGAVMAIVNNFAVFDVAVALTGLPSPLYAAHTVVAHLFDFAFIRFEMGYAAAVAVILFVTTYGCSRVAMGIFRSDD